MFILINLISLFPSVSLFVSPTLVLENGAAVCAKSQDGKEPGLPWPLFPLPTPSLQIQCLVSVFISWPLWGTGCPPHEFPSPWTSETFSLWLSCHLSANCFSASSDGSSSSAHSCMCVLPRVLILTSFPRHSQSSYATISWYAHVRLKKTHGLAA